MKTGLVLEGTKWWDEIYIQLGVDAFTKHSFMPDYLIGVSAGASNGVSYISGQKGEHFVQILSI